jgi:hypothetical protein
MKRRVRIYKAGGQHGSYINKTAQYFQEGGMQMQEEVAPEEQPAQEPSDEQVITFIMQTLSQPNGSIEQAKQQLVQANINPARITQLSEAALEYINQQQDIALAEATGNEEDAAAMQLEQDANDRAVAEEEQAAQQAAQNQEMYAQSEESAVDPNENDDSSAAYMRSGGMPNKRAYISNFIKLAKKQEGGDTEESKSDIKTDIPVGGRVEKVSKFHNALKSTANNVALKEQAEKQYEQQMQQMQQMPPQGYAQDGGDTESGISDFDPYHNLEHYSGAFEHSMPFNALTEAQFGGWGHGRERRAARRMNRMMPQGFNQMANIMGNMGNQMINPFMQQQMNPLAQFMPNQGNLGLANIDVRRTGIFGRPKEYTINFNTVSPVTIKDIADTKKQEINNAETTKKEVEETVKEEETNTATTKNAEVKKTADELPEESDITVTTNKVKRNSGKNLSGGNENVNVIGNGTGIMPIPEQQPIQSKGVIQNAINKANQYPSIGTNQNITPITGAKVGPFDFTKIANVGQGMGNVLAQTVQDKAKAEKIAKWKEHLRQEKINALPFLEKQMWYAQHPEDKPKIKPGKKPISTSNNGVIKWQQGGFTDPNSGLYKFMGGGEDMDQANLDYSDSKNISTPYFADGGLYRFAGEDDSEVTDENTCPPGATNCFPQGSEGNKEVVELTEDEKAAKVIADKEAADKLVASKIASDKLAAETARNAYIDEQMKKGNNTNGNVDYENFNYAQQYLQNQGLGINNPFSFISRGNNWNKAIGSPYGTGTLNPISGMIGPNAQVSSINVDKTRMFGPNKGAPKKFTVNYNVPGQPGINASGTPQSYVGSDGQTHWINNGNQSFKGNQETGRKRPVADMLLRSRVPGLQQLGAKMYPWENNNTSESMSGLHDKGDEAYKEHFGHYPGEGKTDEALAAELKFIPPTQEQLENETYNPAPTVESAISMPTKSNLYNPNTIPLDQFTSPELMPFYESSLNPFNQPRREEQVPLEPGQEGPLTEQEVNDQEFYDQQEQQREQDMRGYGVGLLSMPNEQQLYAQSLANENQQDVQDFELQRMYDQNQQYPELGDLESLDYTQQVGPQAISEQVNNPVVQQNKNINQRNRKKIIPVINNNNNNNNKVTTPIKSNIKNNQTKNTNWLDANINQMTRQQKADFQKREGASFNKLMDLKSSVQGDDVNAFKKSAQTIDNAGKKIFDKLTPTQKLDYLNRLKKIDKGLYEGYIALLQKGGTLPKAQFGPPEDIPFGYFKDPNGTGVYRNLAGEIYKPKTNLEGNTDKLMGNEFTQEGNGLTTDKSMGFDSSGTGYRNEGLLSDEEKQAGAMNKVSQKFKNKQEWNIDAKGALDFGNMAGNKLAGFLERSQQAKQNRNMGSKYDASNLYAQTDERDRGTYGQEGDLKPNETGFKGVVQYGGYMEEGGSYEEGGDTWMSEEQIQQFLAEGGELEFV